MFRNAHGRNNLLSFLALRIRENSLLPVPTQSGGMEIIMSKIKTYAKNILIALLTGALSALISMGDMQSFDALVKPPLTPPGFLFPIVWTVLYTLMGIGLTRVQLSDAPKDVILKSTLLYYVQLFFNFFWSIWFFGFNFFLFSFIWLTALLVFIILMTINFYKADRIAGLLQIPYILWVTFAGYLNFMYFILN